MSQFQSPTLIAFLSTQAKNSHTRVDGIITSEEGKVRMYVEYAY
jgi:hypothetical protein